jgi:adenylate cyclase
LIKFIGDASLHVHGAPLDDVNHAKTAVRTALEMIDAVKVFNDELTAAGRPSIGMGVGVNTGETLIGNIGSKEKFGYDVLGDTVSTTARLEGQTKNYGVLLIMGPNTAELVGDEHAVTELDCIAVKGKQQGLKIYTVGCETEEHKQFLKFYYAGEWKNALILLENLKEKNPELKKYYAMMTERLSEGAPGDWSGTYKATSK